MEFHKTPFNATAPVLHDTPITRNPLLEFIDKIRSHFPKVPLENAYKMSKGWSNDVIVSDDGIAFRFPKKDFEQQFRGEIELLPRLIAKGMPLAIPDYKYVAFDRSFAGYRLIPGRELSAEILASFSEDARRLAARQIAEFLSALHSTPLDEVQGDRFTHFTLPHYRSWSKKETEDRLVEVKECVFPLLKEEEKNWITHEFERHLSLSFNYTPTLIHADFRLDQILAHEAKDEVCGVIDFGDCRINDPALDFAGFWSAGEKFLQQVRENYDGHVDGDFIERSKIRSRLWMVAAMLRLVQGVQLPPNFDFIKLRTELGNAMRMNP